MVVDLGKAKVFERHVAHSVERGFDVQSAGADLLQQHAKLLLIHTTSEYQKVSVWPVCKPKRCASPPPSSRTNCS